MTVPPPAPQRPLLRKIAIDLAVMTVLGVLLAVVGPFGSFEEPFPLRLVTWLGFAYIGYVVYSPMGMFVDRAQAALDLPRVWLWIVAVALATFPMAILVWAMKFVSGPVQWPPLERAITHYFHVFVIGGGATALFYVLEKRGEGEARSASPTANVADLAPTHPPANSDPDPISPNPLLDQLPAALGGEVIALEMEDHYVRVHTALGSHLVLMRLRDAIPHIDGIEGRQVHRSWWVARGAVEDVRREGRNVRLVLGEDLVAPVSRAQVSELKAAGWF